MKEDLIKQIEEKINNSIKKNHAKVSIKIKKNNEGEIIVIYNKKLYKNYLIKAISSKQIDIIENNMVIEKGISIYDLEKWFYNLFNPVNYLYVFYGGELNGKTLNKNSIDKIANNTTDDYSSKRENGICVHRKELDNQPIINGYLGPMYENIDFGIVYLRYETQEVYDLLSH